MDTLYWATLQLAHARKKISIEQILEAEDQDKLNLVLVEGPPGIGKSTIAWELCRKWEEFSCMKQCSLVVLLRLREEEVQKIASINQLFFSHDSETIAREVSANHGRACSSWMGLMSSLSHSSKKASFLISSWESFFQRVQFL